MELSIEIFEASIEDESPPEGMSSALKALWWDAKGDWHKAHKLAQSQKDAGGFWLHAYLHRVEGDDSNAGYWYSRAEQRHSAAEHQDEWREIAIELLKNEER